MALMICPDCKRSISTSAPACPHCGRPAQSTDASPSSNPAKAHHNRWLSFITEEKLITLLVLLPISVSFVACAIYGQETPTGNRLLDPIIEGLFGSLLGALVGFYFASYVICYKKGKPFFVGLGVAALAISLVAIGFGSEFVGSPVFSFWPMIGAVRLAKPNSYWARKYYGDEKTQIARARFPSSNWKPDPSTAWYYMSNGKQFGPVSKIELRFSISSGSVNGGDLVKGPGMTEWVRAGDAAEQLR